MPLFRAEDSAGVEIMFVSRDEETAQKKANRDGLHVDTLEEVESTVFRTSIAGTTYANDDGSDRQTIVASCAPGERLRLVHQDNNRHDIHAIRVYRKSGEQIGFVPQDVAKLIIGGMGAKRCYYVAHVCRLRPVRPNSPSLTAEIKIGVSQSSDERFGSHDVTPLEIGSFTNRKRRVTRSKERDEADTGPSLLAIAIGWVLSLFVFGIRVLGFLLTEILKATRKRRG